jgi:hypothetical protein
LSVKSSAHRSLALAGQVDRCLRIFTDVRPEEAVTALLLVLNVLLIIAACCALKPARFRDSQLSRTNYTKVQLNRDPVFL